MKKFTLLFFILFSMGVSGQSVDSTSIEMTIARAFIDSMNDPDIEAMRDFTLNYRTTKALERTPIEKRLEGYQDFKAQMGILEIGSIHKYEPGSIKLLVYATNKDTWFKMGFNIENDKLESLSMLPARDPNKSSKAEGFEEQLEKIVIEGLAPGVSLVTITNGKIDKSVVYGVRNAETNEALKLNDPLHLGSVTKSFTASLVGKLIDDGKISIDMTLGSLFPFEIHESYRSVTIRNVLSHEGGFPGYLTEEDEEEELRLLSLPGSPRDQRLTFVKEVLSKAPAFTPNSGMNYSNAGYAVLAAICEYVANQSWEDQLAEVIFDPLKMKTAGVGWPSDVNPSFPEGHDANGQLQNPKEYYIGSYLDPSGDIHCSMKDLAKYAIAHLNGLRGKDDFLSSSTLQLLHETKDGNPYAGGWMSEEMDGTTIYYHPGSAGTFFSYIALNPANNSGYVITANSGNTGLLGIFRGITNP